MLDPQNTPYTSPWRASQGVPLMNNFEKIDRVITEQHRILVELTEWVNGESH